jgi:hypothetical protein
MTPQLLLDFPTVPGFYLHSPVELDAQPREWMAVEIKRRDDGSLIVWHEEAWSMLLGRNRDWSMQYWYGPIVPPDVEADR